MWKKLLVLLLILAMLPASVLVAPGSAAEQYCAENSIPFGYAP